MLSASSQGPYNVNAPGAVTNAEFTAAMGQVLSRPTFRKFFPICMSSICVSSHSESNTRVSSAGASNVRVLSSPLPSCKSCLVTLSCLNVEGRELIEFLPFANLIVCQVRKAAKKTGFRGSGCRVLGCRQEDSGSYRLLLSSFAHLLHFMLKIFDKFPVESEMNIFLFVVCVLVCSQRAFA